MELCIWTLRVLEYLMRTRVMCHALHQSGHSKQYAIQDVAVSNVNTATGFLLYIDESWGSISSLAVSCLPDLLTTH